MRKPPWPQSPRVPRSAHYSGARDPVNGVSSSVRDGILGGNGGPSGDGAGHLQALNMERALGRIGRDGETRGFVENRGGSQAKSGPPFGVLKRSAMAAKRLSLLLREADPEKAADCQ